MLSAVFLLLGLYQDRTWFGAGVFEPDTFVIRNALVDGLFWTFFLGSASFNTSLWTMHYELFGSFAAYATALVMIFQKSFLRAMVTGALILVFTAIWRAKAASTMRCRLPECWSRRSTWNATPSLPL